MLDHAVLDRASTLLILLRGQGQKLATAESCTGGLIAAALTHFAGSSDVVERGFVTYSNEAKTDLLGVEATLIAANGAVSEAVARAMARGAIAHSRADIAVSVTGIAGPGGGSAEKPVGLVWFGCARRAGGCVTEHRIFPGNRASVRSQAVLHALDMVESRQAVLF